MAQDTDNNQKPVALGRRVFASNLGLLAGGAQGARLRRILDLAGLSPRAGLPRTGDAVLVWGQSPYAPRGAALAKARGADLWRLEDAFLRSVLPGRAGGPFALPLGLMIDRQGGVHFDPARPCDLEDLLARHDFTPALRAAAQVEMARLAHAGLSKYNGFDPRLTAPREGYVLVVDQTRGDASLRASGADEATFRSMLQDARRENPLARIVIRRHPETAQGLRGGHYSDAERDHRTLFADPLLSPKALLAGAESVYTVSSQMGFEAVLAGLRPRLYGQPFYAGWGLSEDRAGAPLRRGRKLEATELFAGAMMLAPLWYDPHRDRLCDLAAVIDTLAADANAWAADRHGWVATNMRLWKRPHLQAGFGRVKPVRFTRNLIEARRLAHAMERPILHWGLPGSPAPVTHVEDGLIRSRGLGAALVPPMSLILDDKGIYYDPRRPSRLESLIAQSVALPPVARARARALIDSVIASKISKYNLDAPLAALPAAGGRKRILVVGQVEDDASILFGAGDIRSNRALLQAARQAEPEAFVIYKPHPDVLAGLRRGALEDAQGLADLVLQEADPAGLLATVDGLWTMTSGMGFEAVLRGVPVTCTGQPFYAGWGLTRDLAPPVARRQARPDVIALAHAALIDYPRYFDPATGAPCPPEVALERLAAGDLPKSGTGLRLLAKAQGKLAGYAHWWR